MATSKTLTPTNVTISIPEFTDQPDQRVNSNCIDKEADAINQINSNIATKFTWTVFLSENNVSVGNSFASTGKSFTLAKASLVYISMSYGTGRPLAIGVKSSESASSSTLALASVVASDISDTSGLTVTALLAAGTYYVWARTASDSGKTNLTVSGMPLGA